MLLAARRLHRRRNLLDRQIDARQRRRLDHGDGRRECRRLARRRLAAGRRRGGPAPARSIARKSRARRPSWPDISSAARLSPCPLSGYTRTQPVYSSIPRGLDLLTPASSAMGLCPLVCDQGWAPGAVADGRRRHLHARAPGEAAVIWSGGEPGATGGAGSVRLVVEERPMMSRSKRLVPFVLFAACLAASVDAEAHRRRARPAIPTTAASRCRRASARSSSPTTSARRAIWRWRRTATSTSRCRRGGGRGQAAGGGVVALRDARRRRHASRSRRRSAAAARPASRCATAISTSRIRLSVERYQDDRRAS